MQILVCFTSSPGVFHTSIMGLFKRPSNWLLIVWPSHRTRGLGSGSGLSLFWEVKWIVVSPFICDSCRERNTSLKKLADIHLKFSLPSLIASLLKSLQNYFGWSSLEHKNRKGHQRLLFVSAFQAHFPSVSTEGSPCSQWSSSVIAMFHYLELHISRLVQYVLSWVEFIFPTECFEFFLSCDFIISFWFIVVRSYVINVYSLFMYFLIQHYINF